MPMPLGISAFITSAKLANVALNVPSSPTESSPFLVETLNRPGFPGDSNS